MTFTRSNGRTADTLRDIQITTHHNPYAEGSCLISFGKTQVSCTASFVSGVPRWLKGQKQGWLTAEYGMLPRATHTRKDREAVRGKQEGRTIEIQRLIGRSLRAGCNLSMLEGFTLHLDCDVLVADGGTRTAAITGAYVAAQLAFQQAGLANPFHYAIAAVSCGLTSQGVVLDMDYQEDSSTLADGNFVRTSQGDWIEIQMTAEQRPISEEQLQEMKILAGKGIDELLALQAEALGLKSSK